MNDQQKKILAAARKLIKVLGIRKTSIEDIAGECSMSKANIYYYFENKMEICNLVSRQA